MISCVYLPLLFFGRGIGFAEDWALRNSKSFAGEAHGVFFRKCVKKEREDHHIIVRQSYLITPRMISCVLCLFAFTLFGRGIGFAGDSHGLFFRKCIKKRKRRPLYSYSMTYLITPRE